MRRRWLLGLGDRRMRLLRARRQYLFLDGCDGCRRPEIRWPYRRCLHRDRAGVGRRDGSQLRWKPSQHATRRRRGVMVTRDNVMGGALSPERDCLAFGPIRFRRRAMAIAYPFLLGTVLVPRYGPAAAAALAVLATVVFIRTAKARVSHQGGNLVISNFFRTIAVPLAKFHCVKFAEPCSAGLAARLEVRCYDGRTCRASGVSIWSDVLWGVASFASKTTRTRVTRTRMFIEGIGLTFEGSTAE